MKAEAEELLKIEHIKKSYEGNEILKDLSLTIHKGEVVVISIPLGILLGIVMTWKNPVTKAVTRVYLEIVRIMPQMVLLFLVFFGTTRAWGWDLSGEKIGRAHV